MEHKRRHERYRFLRTGSIYWTSAEGPASCSGDCFEASVYGLSAEVPRFLPVGTKTTIQLDRFDECLEATVRHCRRQGKWYRIGLQLSQVLPAALQSYLSAGAAEPSASENPRSHPESA